jgi:hypothetical protein
MGIQQGHGHAAWTWTCIIDMDMRIDVDILVGGHRGTVALLTCFMVFFFMMMATPMFFFEPYLSDPFFTSRMMEYGKQGKIFRQR